VERRRGGAKRAAPGGVFCRVWKRSTQEYLNPAYHESRKLEFEYIDPFETDGYSRCLSQDIATPESVIAKLRLR
jgi:hypothetical protein